MRSVGPLLVLKEWGRVGELPARGLRAEQHGLGVTLDQRVLTQCPSCLPERTIRNVKQTYLIGLTCLSLHWQKP